MFKAPQTDGFEGPRDSGNSKWQQAVDTLEGAALMLQDEVVLKMIWIECPQLADANTASIYQAASPER
jgi:hypothetical protein